MVGAVFVTGATGIVGSAVVEQLVRRGMPVIAGVRDPASAKLPDGVEAREFTFGAPAGVQAEALDGADRLFLLRPPAIAEVQTQLFPVVDAANARGLKQIVFLSLQGVQANRRTPHHAVEAHLRGTGSPFTNLRPNFFMQNLVSTHAAEIRDRGEIFVPAGRSFTAFIDARDIGRVAAAVFTQPGHLGRSYTLSGEQTLSYAAVARTMSEVLGRPIRYARPSEAEYLAHLAARGMPEDYLAVQKMIYRIVRFNVSAVPNHSVRRLTGQPATTFAEFVADYRDAWTPLPERLE